MVAPEPQERIARMVAQGVITPEQASRLGSSLVSAGMRQHVLRRPDGFWTPRPTVLTFVALGLWIVAILLGDSSGAIQGIRELVSDPGSVLVMSNVFSGMLALFLLVALPAFGWMWVHNALVGKEDATHSAWAQVTSNFQQRADLIPAVLETISRYLDYGVETGKPPAQTRAGHLGETVGDLVDAQAAAAVLLDRHGRDIIEDDDALAALERAERLLTARIGSFIAVAESYPELRSSRQFLELQAQVEGTENRINVTRTRFNASVEEYNSRIRKIPASLVARAGDFRRKGYYKAEPNAIDASELSFQ